MAQNNSTKVIIADDHPIIRFGIKSNLDRLPGVSVVGEADNGQETLRLVRELSPDVLILDLDMPVIDGAQVLKTLHQEMPGLRILVLSEDYAIYSAARTRTMGASGHFLKTEDLSRLVRSVQRSGRSSGRPSSYVSIGLPGL
jgi:DNA-binding NarL/FixJ family response regulator